MHQSSPQQMNVSVKFYSWLSEIKPDVSANGGSVLVFWIDTISACKEDNIFATLLYIFKELIKLRAKF